MTDLYEPSKAILSMFPNLFVKFDAHDRADKESAAWPTAWSMTGTATEVISGVQKALTDAAE